MAGSVIGVSLIAQQLGANLYGQIDRSDVDEVLQQDGRYSQVWSMSPISVWMKE